ncbi:MAG: hypothetical protein NTY94_09710 [Alphaproteobacteria bacterium]|jgi:hypothetical protein|nr:hypothetical protein [Alphaproteobacteria bacterium]
MRKTVVTIDRIEPTGNVFVHEASGKRGFFTNTTPRSGELELQEGASLDVDVTDIGEVMVIKSARSL